MATVDLVYDADCPNISVARANLIRAFSVAGIQPKWSEHRIGDATAPERTRGYGSPTVLVDGRDVSESSGRVGLLLQDPLASVVAESKLFKDLTRWPAPWPPT